MAGQIIVSSIKTDSDNSISFLANTGATIFSANLASGLSPESFGNNTITSDKIVSVANTQITGTITTAQIADGAITSDKIDTVANTKIDGLITSDQIANVAADKIIGTLGGNYASQIFTSPGTWDADTKIAAGLKSVKVTVIGAGGGGMGHPGTPGPAGAGTGATGGTSSFGAFASATGGGGGQGTYSPSTGLITNIPGVGGLGSSGDINLGGGSGFTEITRFVSGSPATFSACGGSTPLGAGGSTVRARLATNNGYGGGGGGGAQGAEFGAGGGGGGTSIITLYTPNIPGPVSVTIGIGGAKAPTSSVPQAQSGANGVVIIEEFY